MEVTYSLNITLTLAEAKLIQKAFEKPGELQGARNKELISFQNRLDAWKLGHPFADKIWDFVKEVNHRR